LSLDEPTVGLNVSLAWPSATPEPDANPVSRRADQPQWRHSASGRLRHNVSPSGFDSPLQIFDVNFPLGARGAYAIGPRHPRLHQQVWVLQGRIELTLGEQSHRLDAGDCLAMQLDRPLSCDNRTRKPATVRSCCAVKPAPGDDMQRVRRLQQLSPADIDALAQVLVDCVEGGASVSFMHPLALPRARAFWQQVGDEVARGERALLVADDAAGIAGTVQLVLVQPENQPHRADLAKMLVHRRARHQGMGAALLAMAEQTARDCGKTLLVLNTASAEAERLYLRAGWQHCSVVPDYALLAHAGLWPTTIFLSRVGRSPVGTSRNHRRADGLLTAQSCRRRKAAIALVDRAARRAAPARRVASTWVSGPTAQRRHKAGPGQAAARL
jgi:GNAT superfamily N-acetyltransferase